jgi:AcrR family transcriptional regulator
VARGKKQDDRRSAIIQALKQCMVDRGYADTTLSDLARCAGLSVSHFLYYFPSKDAVLLEVCAEILDKTLNEITAYRDEPPEERIHVLVDHLFLHTTISRGEFVIVQELIALSVHRPAISRKMTEYYDAILAYLNDLFEKVPRRPGLAANDAANIAAALWQGLFTNSMFATDLDEPRARRLYRRILWDLANIRGVHDATGLGRLVLNEMFAKAQKRPGRKLPLVKAEKSAR